MKNFYDAGDVDFGVFRERMVAVNEEGRNGERAQNGRVFSLHADFWPRKDFLCCSSANREEDTCVDRGLTTCGSGFTDAERIVIQIELCLSTAFDDRAGASRSLVPRVPSVR